MGIGKKMENKKKNLRKGEKRKHVDILKKQKTA